MVMTVLEAHVTQENWEALERSFQQAASHKDAGLVQSFLVHSRKDAGLWQIITIWESQEALSAMRSSGETPRGVLIFRDAHAEPGLMIFDIAHHIPA